MVTEALNVLWATVVLARGIKEYTCWSKELNDLVRFAQKGADYY